MRPPRAGHGPRYRDTGLNPPRRCCEAARHTHPWQIQRGGGGGQQKEAKANSATKDKQFLSQVKHRVRHERLVSLLVCVVLSFALLFCHCLLAQLSALQVIETARGSAQVSRKHVQRERTGQRS